MSSVVRVSRLLCRMNFAASWRHGNKAVLSVDHVLINYDSPNTPYEYHESGPTEKPSKPTFLPPTFLFLPKASMQLPSGFCIYIRRTPRKRYVGVHQNHKETSNRLIHGKPSMKQTCQTPENVAALRINYPTLRRFKARSSGEKPRSPGKSTCEWNLQPKQQNPYGRNRRAAHGQQAIRASIMTPLRTAS